MPAIDDVIERVSTKLGVSKEDVKATLKAQCSFVGNRMDNFEDTRLPYLGLVEFSEKKHSYIQQRKKK